MSFTISLGEFVIEHGGSLRETYKMGKKLGEGAFSTVRVVQHRQTGESRAAKVINMKRISIEEKESIQREVAILKSLDHPNIIRIHECYEDGDQFYIITELCNGGEVFAKIIETGSFSEAQAAMYVRQILSVVIYLHERNLVHRDLKPENFLLSTTSEDATLKVIDFGTAAYFEQGKLLTERIGTPYYIAPEILEHNYNEKADLWSTGICMFIMLSGYPPFGGNTDYVILNNVKGGRFHFYSPDWDNISFEAKDLICQLLKMNPAARIEAKDALKHPWLNHASRLALSCDSASKYLQNLTSFRSEQGLKRAIVAFIGSQLSTGEERDSMIELFKSIDTDENGTLSREELKEGFQQLFDGEVEDVDGEVDRIMLEVDIDGNGCIDYTEFVTATMSRQQLLNRERLELAFRAFDADDSGSISAAELKQMLGKSMKGDDTMWAELIAEVDVNNDGEIDFEEFVAMMTSQLTS